VSIDVAIIFLLLEEMFLTLNLHSLLPAEPLVWPLHTLAHAVDRRQLGRAVTKSLAALDITLTSAQIAQLVKVSNWQEAERDSRSQSNSDQKNCAFSWLACSQFAGLYTQQEYFVIH
jgi:hypothetical protein